jgi:NADPH:quinone reductase
MTRVIFTRTGGPDVLELDHSDPGDPGPGQLRIRQQAIGLNYIDTYHRTGLYPVPLPSGIGLEAAGVVEAVGEGVSHFAPGDPVGGCWGPIGAYADVRLVPASAMIKLPEGVSSELAAALLLKGCTAEYLIRRTYPVQPGDWVLVHAAAGGVGLIIGQWLSALGARAIGTAGGPEKCALASANGYEHVIDYRAEDVAARVAEVTDGAKCAVVYDGVGKDTWAASLDSCRLRGTIVSFGNASGPVNGVDLGTLAAKGGLYVTRPSLFHYYTDPAERAAGCAALFAAVAAGQIKVHIAQRFALQDAAAAHRALETRQTTGSTLLMP